MAGAAQIPALKQQATELQSRVSELSRQVHAAELERARLEQQLKTIHQLSEAMGGTP